MGSPPSPAWVQIQLIHPQALNGTSLPWDYMSQNVSTTMFKEMIFEWMPHPKGACTRLEEQCFIRGEFE
jgi:hypothetical protein